MSDWYYDPEAVINAFDLKGKNGRQPRVDGEDLIACCPFPHFKDGQWRHERNPSFGINLTNGKFNCYSCGTRGRTLDYLATLLDIETGYIPKIRGSIHYAKKSQEEPDVGDAYLKFLTLHQNKAEDYFISRGMDIPDTIQKFRIGASADGSSIYLPILNVEGHLAGWAERQKYKQPKWINQPEGFEKANFLYGLYESLDTKKIILVESFIDVLRLDSFGYRACSTLGAGVSPTQIELILDYFDEITLIPHNDEAGKKWTQTLAEELYDRSNLYITRLPSDYKDTGEVEEKDVIDAVLAKRKLVKKMEKRRENNKRKRNTAR